MRNQEQRFYSTEKVWKTKVFVSGRAGLSVHHCCFLGHKSAFSLLSRPPQGILPFKALHVLCTHSCFLTLDLPGFLLLKGKAREAVHILSFLLR